MVSVIHDPDVCRTGKNAAKKVHAWIEDFIDFERAKHDRLAAGQTTLNVVNSKNQSVPLGMYLNNDEGDCTCAGACNTVRVNSGGVDQPTDEVCQDGYVTVTGKDGAAFNPATGANDNGCAEVDVLDYWTTDGFGSNKILGHAGVDVQDFSQVQTVHQLGGGVYWGWQLATDQQNQAIWQPGQAAPGSWGGHCAPTWDCYESTPAGLIIAGTSIPTGSRLIVAGTWAEYKAIFWDFVPFAADEGHMVITADWVAANENNPLVSMPALKAYLATLQPEQ